MSARDVIEAALTQKGVVGVLRAEYVIARLTAAGYRILGPDELDPVTVEQCAAVIETNTIVDTINGKELRPRIMGDQFALFYAAAIRALPTGGER